MKLVLTQATMRDLGDPYTAQKKSRKAKLEYLIVMLSLYTKDKLKAYKYFLDGWISNVTVYSVLSGTIQLLAQYVIKQCIQNNEYL